MELDTVQVSHVFISLKWFFGLFTPELIPEPKFQVGCSAFDGWMRQKEIYKSCEYDRSFDREST